MAEIIAASHDVILREQIRQRDKAIRDYENDMAFARSEGITEGLMKALKSRVDSGIEESQAKKILGLV